MPPNKYPRFDAVAVNQCGQVQYSFVCPAPACEQSGKAALTSFIGSNVWRCKSATCSAAKKSYKMTVANANDNLRVIANANFVEDQLQTPAAPARVQADLKLDADNVQTPAASVRVQENSDRLKRMQARKTGVKNRREPVPSTPPQVTTPT